MDIAMFFTVRNLVCITSHLRNFVGRKRSYSDILNATKPWDSTQGFSTYKISGPCNLPHHNYAIDTF